MNSESVLKILVGVQQRTKDHSPKVYEEGWLAIRLSICPPSMVWLKTGLHFLCVPQPSLASFSATCQQIDSRLTLTARLNPLCRSCHTVHLSSDFTAALPTQLHLAKEKQDLWMNITLRHLRAFEFPLPFNKYLIELADTHRPVCCCLTRYT